MLLSLGLTKQEALHLARTNGAGVNSAEEIVAKALKIWEGDEWKTTDLFQPAKP